MSRPTSRRRTEHIKGWVQAQELDRNAGRDYAARHDAAERGAPYDPSQPAAWREGWRAAMEPR